MNRSALASYGTSPEHVEDWRAQARCLEYDPELFWPIGTTGSAVPQIAEAVAVCWTCPVRETCLRYALDNGITEGVWGGLPEDERRSLKRREDRERLDAKRTQSVGA